MEDVLRQLIDELREQYPPAPDSLALLAWTCKHGVTFEDWYAKEVVCQLTHKAA